MITNVTSTTTNAAVSEAIDSDSFTAVTTTVTDDTTSVEINTESPALQMRLPPNLPTQKSALTYSQQLKHPQFLRPLSMHPKSLTTQSLRLIIYCCHYSSNTMRVYLGHHSKSSYSNNKKFVSANRIKTISDSSNNSTPIPSNIVKVEEVKTEIHYNSYKSDRPLKLINLDISNRKN